MSRKHHRSRLRIHCSCGVTAPETLTDPWTWPTLCHAPARHHSLLQSPVSTAGSSLALPGAEHSHWSNQSAQHSKKVEQVVEHIAVDLKCGVCGVASKLAMPLSYNNFAAICPPGLADQLLDDMMYSICLSVCQPVCEPA